MNITKPLKLLHPIISKRPVLLFFVSSFLVSLKHPPSFFIKAFVFICSSFSFISTILYLCLFPHPVLIVSHPFLSLFLLPFFLFFPQPPQEAPLVCVCMQVCVLMSLELSLPQGEVPRWGDQHCWSCRYQPQTPAWLSTTAHKCATLMLTHTHGRFALPFAHRHTDTQRKKIIPFLCFTCTNVNAE